MPDVPPPDLIKKHPVPSCPDPRGAMSPPPPLQTGRANRGSKIWNLCSGDPSTEVVILILKSRPTLAMLPRYIVPLNGIHSLCSAGEAPRILPLWFLTPSRLTSAPRFIHPRRRRMCATSTRTPSTIPPLISLKDNRNSDPVFQF